VRFSTSALAIGAMFCCALPVLADNCATIPGNLVANCDFEDGTYTSTIPYLPNPPNSDPGVPNSWSADPNFIEGYIESGGALDDVTSMGGADYLSIGTTEFGELATLSTGFTDVSGLTYDGSLYVQGTGTFLAVLDNDYSDPSVFLSAGSGVYTFSFTGTGSDELSLAAYGGPWYVNDVVIAPAGESAVPEPRGTLLIPIAILACLVWLSKRRGAVAWPANLPPA
jgi:hypothetical protein